MIAILVESSGALPVNALAIAVVSVTTSEKKPLFYSSCALISLWTSQELDMDGVSGNSLADIGKY